MSSGNELLRQARDEQGLSQAELAAPTGVSVETISLYERGLGTPERGTLLRILRTLRLDRRATNAILTGAGLEPVPVGRLVTFEKWRRGLQHLQQEVDGYGWPCLVLNNRMEIICWNPPAVRVAELDFAQELPALSQRNLMRIAAMPHFEKRVRNWDKVVSEMIGTLKGEGSDLGDPEEGPIYFAALVQDLARDRPDLFPKILGLWASVPPRTDGHRVTFVIEWQLGDGTPLNFNCMISGWTDFDAAWALDWHPADAQTWSWLHEHASAAPLPSAPATPDGPTSTRRRSPNAAVPAQAPWQELLRQGREGTRLGRRELAALSGTSAHTLHSYEAGKRRPSREAVLRLAWAMELDAATTNLILDDLGLDPEPSEWARRLTGLPPRQKQWRSADPAAETRRVRTRLAELIAEHSWPCLVLNAECELVAVNPVAERVLGAATPRQQAVAWRSVVSWVLSPAFRAHAVNWDEVATALLPGSIKQAALHNDARPAARPLEPALAQLRAGDPETLSHLQDLWTAAPAVVLGERVTVPLVWRHDDGAILSFACIVSVWIASDLLWAIDLHPADATTCTWLDRHREESFAKP